MEEKNFIIEFRKERGNTQISKAAILRARRGGNASAYIITSFLFLIVLQKAISEEISNFASP